MPPEVAIGAIGRIQVCVMLTAYSQTQCKKYQFTANFNVPDQIKPDIFIPKLLLKHITIRGIQR